MILMWNLRTFVDGSQKEEIQGDGPYCCVRAPLLARRGHGLGRNGSTYCPHSGKSMVVSLCSYHTIPVFSTAHLLEPERIRLF